MKYILNKPLCIYELGGRTNQEDFQIPSDDGVTADSRLFILCDGMGGHESGEVASRTVSETMYEWIERHRAQGKQITIDLFNEALAAAYDALDEKDKSTTERKMGTTMTFLMLTDEGAMVAHIGDSRVYQFRPGQRKPLFMTRDHSLVNDLIMIGEITEEEAKTAPNRNVITRAIQPHQERRAKADIAMLTDVKSGDWFYMCSDGMLEKMEDDELADILTNEEWTDEKKRQELIDRTKNNRDNHSAFLIHVKEVIRTAQGGPDEYKEGPVAVIVGVDEESPVLECDNPIVEDAASASEHESGEPDPEGKKEKDGKGEKDEKELPATSDSHPNQLPQVMNKKEKKKGCFITGLLLVVLAILLCLLVRPAKNPIDWSSIKNSIVSRQDRKDNPLSEESKPEIQEDRNDSNRHNPTPPKTQPTVAKDTTPSVVVDTVTAPVSATPADTITNPLPVETEAAASASDGETSVPAEETPASDEETAGVSSLESSSNKTQGHTSTTKRVVRGKGHSSGLI